MFIERLNAMIIPVIIIVALAISLVFLIYFLCVFFNILNSMEDSQMEIATTLKGIRENLVKCSKQLAEKIISIVSAAI